MPPPTKQLSERLADLQLCGPAQLDACKSSIRRLYQDLPDFDSVWLDALVQQNVITSWQADRLLNFADSEIRVGDIVLQERLGAHSLNGQDKASHSVFVQEIVGWQPPESQNRNTGRRAPVIDRLHRLLEELPASFQHASIALPDRLLEEDTGRVVVVSPYVAGWTADALLVRGGRLPWQAVADIGAQLIDVLSKMEHAGFLHGDLRLRNLRLCTDGRAVLVRPFVKQLAEPALSIAQASTLAHVEGAAPERVGAGRPVDVRSELYSLGCLLWHLLTARPPFLSADPVTMLQQAQSAELPSLRELVPDCPEWLVAQIHSMSRRSPDLRPASFSTVSEAWTRRRQNGRHVRALLKQMPDRQKQRAPHRATSRMGSVLAACLLLPLFGFYAWYRGLVPQTLSLSRESEPTVSVEGAEQPDAVEDSAILALNEEDSAGMPLPLPQPDLAGVVMLKSGAVYVASDLQFAGVMHIEPDGREPAWVRVPSGGWNVAATHVVLSGLHITSTARNASDVKSGVDVKSHMLSIQDCVIGRGPNQFGQAGVVWTPTSGETRVLKVRDVEFTGGGYGVWIQDAPGRLELTNVLFRQDGGAIRIDAENLNSVVCQASKVTQVGGHSFLDVVPTGESSTAVKIGLKCGESVLAPSDAIVRIAPPETLSPEAISVEFLLPERGNPTIVPPAVDPVLYFDRSLRQFTQANKSQVLSESLLLAKPVFRGTSEEDADSRIAYQLIDYEGPKLSSALPGFQLDDLPPTIPDTIE